MTSRDVSVKAIVERASEIYSALYKTDGSQLTGAIIRACVRVYEYRARTKTFQTIVSECVRVRGDCYTSDREIASLILALEYYHVRD